MIKYLLLMCVILVIIIAIAVKNAVTMCPDPLACGTSYIVVDNAIPN